MKSKEEKQRYKEEKQRRKADKKAHRTPRQRRRKKIIMATSIGLAVAVVGGSVAFVGSILLKKATPNTVSLDYGSVSYAVKNGEIFTPEKYESGEYSAVDVFGRLNWTFQQQTNWSAHMSGWVDASVTMQDVFTEKRYSDGVLISSDITSSKLINAARQFCYVKDNDRVIWRTAAGGSSTYNGLDTPWKTGNPTGSMYINYHEDLNNNGLLDEGEDLNGNGILDIGFKATKGLPAYELSVYVFEPNTVIDASAVVRNDDGTYSITYTLGPNHYDELDDEGNVIAERGATVYYENQMVFTGGLPEVPSFESINVTATFDANWKVYSMQIEESYVANYGFTVGCTSGSTTTYEYDLPETAEEVNRRFSEYFKDYVDAPVTGAPTLAEPTAVGSLGEAFGPLLGGESVLDVTLTLDDKPYNGAVYLDLNMGDGGFESLDVNAIKARVKLDPLELWLDEGRAYLHYGNMRASMSVSELLELVKIDSVSGATSSVNTDDLLESLANGTFTYVDQQYAKLDATLSLFDMEIPLSFSFNLDKNNRVSLDYVSATFSIDGMKLGLRVAFGDKAPAELPESARSEYVALKPYVDSLISLFSSDVLHADIAYNNAEVGVSVTGGVDVAYKGSVRAAGAFTVNYRTAAKMLSFAYEAGAVYLDLDGIRFKANANEAYKLIMSFLPEHSGTNGAGINVGKLISTVFSEDFANNFALSDEKLGEGRRMTLALKGSELLEAFGVEFDLGTVVVTAETAGNLGVSALGASLTVSKGEKVTIDSTGYVDVMEYATKIADIFRGGYIAAELTYGGEEEDGLKIAGTINLALSPVAVQLNLTISYGEITKDVDIAYAEDGLLLKIDDLKVKVDVDEAMKLIKSIISVVDPEEGNNADEMLETLAADSGSEDAGEESEEVGGVEALVERLLKLNFGEVLSVTEENETLSVILRADALLTALGVNFTLGDISMSWSNGVLCADAVGAHLAIKAGKPLPAVDAEDYMDLTTVLAKVPELLASVSVSFSGELVLNVEDTTIALNITNGIISWANGFNAYLEFKLLVGDGAYDFRLAATEKEIKLVYGSDGAYEIGANIAYSELGSVSDALLAVYGRIRDIVQNTVGDVNPLPEIKSFDDILKLLRGGAAATQAADSAARGFDWTGMLKGITFEASKEGGYARVTLGNLSAEILKSLSDDGLLRLFVNYTSDAFSMEGTLETEAFKGNLDDYQLPDENEVTYLTATNLADLIDYIGAAVELVVSDDVTFEVSGAVEDLTAETEGDAPHKFDFEGKVSYHRGAEKTPIHLDVDGKNFWVNSDLYFAVNFVLKAADANDQSLWLDVFVVDAAPAEDGAEAVTDGNLDFYISVSQFAPGTEKHSPLKLYAPADEILTLLSAAVKIIGIEDEYVNGFLVNKWLKDLTTVDQLRALGDSLLPMVGLGELAGKDLGGALEFLLGMFGGIGEGEAQPEEGGAPEGVSVLSEEDNVPTDGVRAQKYLSKLDVSAESLVLALNSSAVYGAEGLEDLTFTAKKSNGRLTSLQLENVYNAEATERTSITKGEISYEPIKLAAPSGSKGYTSFLGAEKLLFALAKSATHGENENNEIISGEETPHHYAVNRNFYIEGDITAKLQVIRSINISVNIHLIAVSVTIDEDNKIGVNARIAYDGVQEVNQIAINGDSVVDLTFKEGMVYVKRVQTSYWSKGILLTTKEIYETPVVLYRAMPMENFMGDILNQISFILNFGDMITSKFSEKDPNESTEPTPEEVLDYGKKLNEVLQSYTYTANEDGSQTWDLEIDGSSFSNNILGKVKAKISADKDGYITSFVLPSAAIQIPGVSAFLINITCAANLNWYNPGGVMAEGVSVKTDSTLAETLTSKENAFGGMIEKLNAANGWWNAETNPEGQKFLEGKEFTVKYWNKNYAGDGTDALGSQQVYVSTGADGNTINTLYSSLVYPKLLENVEFCSEWITAYRVGDVLPIDGNVYAQQRKQTYAVTFKSADDLGDFWSLGADGLYYRVFDMEYGATVTFMANGETYGPSYTITENCTIALPEKAPYAEDASVEGHWGVSLGASGAVFTVLYDLHTVTYKSEVAFEVNGTNYTSYDKQFKESTNLIEPSVGGYTFLGWYTHTESGWEQISQNYLDELITSAVAADELLDVTFEALWISDLEVTVTEAVRTNESGWAIKKYDYTVKASVKGGELVGAFAKEDSLSVSMSYTFEAYTSKNVYNPIGEVPFNAYTPNAEISGNTNKRDYAKVSVSITYEYTAVGFLRNVSGEGLSNWTTL